jgi:ABC-type transporter Mla subunit MlaD
MPADSRSVAARPEGVWLSRGLIAYGIVGLVVSAIGLGSMVWVNGRISDVRSEARATVARLATTTHLAAIVLRGASTTVGSFGGTADETARAVSSATGTITEVRADLSALEAQLRSVSIFGATPLSSSADAVARIAASMEGLTTQLPLIAGGLEGNRDALARNAAALTELADSTTALAARLGPSVGQDSLDDVQRVIAITLLMFAAWSFVPALGALALGIWLLRQLSPSPSA